MIVQLMREQARAHRASLVWTACLLTLAIAMAAFSAFSAAQQSAIEGNAARAYGLDGEWTRALELDATYPGAETMARADFDAALDAADAEGAMTAASHELSGIQLGRDVPGAETQTWDGAIGDQDVWWSPPPRGVRGAVDWDALLLEGTPPGPGEIAVNAIGAEVLGVGLGDTVTVVAELWDPQAGPDYVPLARLTVSALMRTGVQDRFELFGSAGIVDWDDSFALRVAAAEANDPGGDVLGGGYVDAAAQVETPALGAVPGWPGSPWFGGAGADIGMLVVLAVGAAVLVVGLIGMAFAVGRSQAQARTQWVATARVLGARRSSIVLASVGEVTLLGLAAGLVGTGIACLAMQVHWSAFAGAHPEALLPDGVQTPAWLQASFVGLGVVVAAIMGAIPAFWAARVTPAAALKPVTPVTQAELSRRVSPAWIYGIWAATFGALVVTEALRRDGDAWLWASGTLVLVVGVTTVAALVEASRWVVTAMGRRLARSTRPWALAAGDGLLGHVRQAAVPAAVLAIAMTALAGVATWSALYSWGNVFPWEWTWRGVPGWPQLPEALAVAGEQSPGGMAGGPRTAIGALGAALLVLAALAAFASTSLATRMDDAARRALGLTGRDARLAAAARFGLPLAAGAALGSVIGIAMVTATYQGWQLPSDPGPDFSGEVMSEAVGPAWAFTHLGHAVVPVAVSLVLALMCVAAGSLAAALMVRIDKPARAREDAPV